MKLWEYYKKLMQASGFRVMSYSRYTQYVQPRMIKKTHKLIAVAAKNLVGRPRKAGWLQTLRVF